MKQIIFSSEFFNVKDTLECGQVFRFTARENGFLVFSGDKCAYAFNQGAHAYIQCEDDDEEYFSEYFDLKRDYSKIYDCAIKARVEILKKAAERGRGIRILNQNKVETLFSFIVSQNNNIPRIKGIIEKLCAGLGEKKTFLGVEYFAFPSVEKMANAPLEFYKSIGLGYRAEYILRLAKDICAGFDIEEFCSLDTVSLKKRLVNIYGVGPKVADCVSLFGFHKSDSFPVDTWIEKVYREDFKGKIKNRAQIAEWFVENYKENSGYFQQYLFHFKRIIEKNG